MTTTLIARSLLGRARTQSVEFAVAVPAWASAHAETPVHAMFPVAIPTTDVVSATNPWLGGDVRGSGFGSKYATKRIAPGRLEGMT